MFMPSCMSVGATAKSLEGVVIGVGFTIGVLQYVTVEEIHAGWIRNCVKADGARGSGKRKSPVGSRSKAPVRCLEDGPPEARNGSKNLRKGRSLPFLSSPLIFSLPLIPPFLPLWKYGLLNQLQGLGSALISPGGVRGGACLALKAFC